MIRFNLDALAPPVVIAVTLTLGLSSAARADSVERGAASIADSPVAAFGSPEKLVSTGLLASAPASAASRQAKSALRTSEPLTDQQRERLIELGDQFEIDVARTRARIVALHHEMISLLAGKEIDRKAVLLLQKKSNILKDELALKKAGLMADRAAVLSARQRRCHYLLGLVEPPDRMGRRRGRVMLRLGPFPGLPPFPPPPGAALFAPPPEPPDAPYPELAVPPGEAFE